jgi:TPR repeat protein
MFQLSNATYEGWMRDEVAHLRRRADAGEPGAQFAGAVLWQSYPDAARYIEDDEARRWMLGAVRASFAPALTLTGIDGLGGNFGDPIQQVERGHGIAQVVQAARNGFPPAQIIVADELAAATDLDPAQRWTRARSWLELAAASGDAIARIRLAHLLVTCPVESLRDIQRAREVARGLESTWSFEPRLQEIRAALR